MKTTTDETAPAVRKKKQYVWDERGTQYELGNKLAKGGEGLVLRIAGYERQLVKVSLWPDADERTQRWRRRIETVQRMPILEHRLPIVMPQALIVKPRAGYVMELMDGLIPLEKLLEQAHEAFCNQEGLTGYVASGGLGRRLRLLARLARVLAQLHGLAIAHGDLSPRNVFVSNSPEHSQVWLIDCDSLSYAVRDSSLKLCTQYYGAPEIMRGDAGISTFTDIWSFAVMAFELLTLLHPFKSGTRVDSDSELEEPALRGELPWVDHPEDDSNQATSGVPREMVCTPALQALFDRCFRDGVQHPAARPVMAEWAEAMEAAAALQVTCDEAAGGCGSTFLWNTALECPFCGMVHPADSAVRLAHFIYARLQDLGEGANLKDRWIPTAYHQVVGANAVELRSSPPGSATYLESEILASLWIEGDTLVLNPSGKHKLWVQHQGSSSLMPLNNKLSLERKGIVHALHLGKADRAHGTWRFKW